MGKEEQQEDKRLLEHLVNARDLSTHSLVRAAEVGVRHLRRLSGPLHRLYELECDRNLTEAETAKRDELESAARSVAGKLGVKVRFNRDPRGYPIRLTWAQPKGERQPSNNWGGEDWGM